MRPFDEWVSAQIEKLQDKIGETFNDEPTLEEALLSINDEVVYEDCVKDEINDTPDFFTENMSFKGIVRISVGWANWKGR